MKNEPVFDLKKSIAAKEEGMAIAANASSDLDVARQIAEELGEERRFVHQDMVGIEAMRRGLILNLGPAAGSTFKDKNKWRFSGDRVRSAKVSNHAREIKVWEYIA